MFSKIKAGSPGQQIEIRRAGLEGGFTILALAATVMGLGFGIPAKSLEKLEAAENAEVKRNNWRTRIDAQRAENTVNQQETWTR